MMTGNGKVRPNLDQESTKILNRTVLQRVDPFVEEILITASHVTLYEFDVDISQWSRKDVEGSLFVVKRSAQPRFRFVVMNRRSTDNLVENILGDFEYEIQLPYLLYRNANQEVNGIWFYNANECEQVANLLARILGAYSKMPTKSKMPKSDFEELEALPTMAVIDGPLEPSSTTTSNVSNIHDEPAFLNFFDTATKISSGSNATGTIQQYQSSSTNPLASYPSTHAQHTMPTFQIPSTVSMTTPIMTQVVDSESRGITNIHNHLVKPSLFFSHPSSSSLTTPLVSSAMPTAAPPLYPPVNLQRPYGTPLLQPFPPPTPSPLLTPNPTHIYAPVINRDQIRDAFMMLVQDNQFIEMICQALEKTYER